MPAGRQAADYLRLGERGGVEVEDVDGGVLTGRAGDVLQPVAPHVGPYHHFMLAPQQGECAVERRVEVDLFVIVTGAVRPILHRRIRLVGVIANLGKKVGVGPDQVGGDGEVPVLVEAVLDIGEDVAVDLVQIGPLAGERLRAREVVRAAVQVGGQTTPVVAVVVVLLEGRPQRDRGRVTQVGFADGVEQLVVLACVVLVAVFRVVHQHRAAAQGALCVQRAADIELGAVVVPRAGADFRLELVFTRGSLAHHVDRRRRVTCALHQTVGAADNLHPVVHGHVVHRHDVHRETFGDTARQAIELQVVDLEPA
ncbi:hypothetical protein D3C81_877070 [compost metagenome]